MTCFPEHSGPETSVLLRKGTVYVLVIRADLVNAMVAHARRDHPDEACGVLAGPEGSDRPERHIPMTNAERSPTFYRDRKSVV